ncbi:hypothetical protein [Streptomyces sp. NPDC020571]
MYETMVFWGTVHTEADLPPHILQYARDWHAAKPDPPSRAGC